MNKFLDEYGGVIAASITGLAMLGFLYYLLEPNNNSLFNLIAQFFYGFGATQI